VLPHRALVNLLVWHWSELTPAARTLQYASVSFDASVHEIFSALCSGGSVYQIEESLRQDIAGLARFIAENEIEKAILPVVVLEQLTQEFCWAGSGPPKLRELIATGEQLQITRDMVEFFKWNSCTLHNHYGPSETHVVTAFTLSGDPDAWPARPPIGRPIANTQIYLVDEHMRPAPVGVTGELYIGGVSLADGYWNRPELTAERFIDDPFSGRPKERLYRTGDLARWLPEGNIEFLGRIDDQVKIRGYRVEIGEIEAALARHSGVSQAAVVVREECGDRRLAAYVVTKDDLEVSASELRAYLKETLPEYMVPSFIVLMEEMPLTANRKINRRALPAPWETDGEAGKEYVAPRTATEELLAAIWAEVLGASKVGVRDNFFDLGGHSLLAMRAANTIRDMFQLPVNVSALFQFPTVERLREYLCRQHGEKMERAAEAIAQVLLK
jgi:acyl-coenzyme A synthetase/AMP-(fatty) acid ligase